jgi:transposase-like protein
MWVELRSEQRFFYQEISAKVAELTRLGMSHRSIAAAMGIDRNTVWKAVQWSKK